MNVLFETDKLRIEHEFENAFLIEKISGKELMCDSFYGDPACGLISLKNDWAIIAGEHLTIWREGKSKDQQVKRIEHEDLKWIHAIRLKSENIVKILTDPWSEKSEIWELNIDSLQFTKIRDFKDCFDTEFKENIDW
ncbi:hypothetical protein C9994_03550 [Marivirga lumbricoides]|uniref:Uncharacterized protein n=1 Tax=Marivirga lumbricoides TaxID=1046115 RepID=A0A2T4DTU8_9BACT|nr:hypothetical protein C9994_03550 [Marivirga lumbricoides]